MTLPLLIDPTDCIPLIGSDQLDQMVIVDLGKRERYEQEHLPGAKLVTPGETQAGPPIPGLLPSDEALSSLFTRLNIAPDTHVIVYDDEGGGWAGRFIWILDEIGHTQYSYLDGGLVSWKNEEGPLESGLSDNQLVPNVQKLSSSGKFTINADDIIAQLPKKEFQVWDARSPAEYRAEKLNAKRGGHIPGAINYEWTSAMDKENGLRLKPLQKLKEELNDLGISGELPIVTHCQTHHRSGLTYLISKLLGYDAKAYAGSWGEWGNRTDTPIEA